MPEPEQGQRAVPLAAVEENARRILDYTDPPFTALMKEDEFQDLARAFLDLLHPTPSTEQGNVLKRIRENARSWHGAEPDMGHVRALAVIATWCDEALASLNFTRIPQDATGVEQGNVQPWRENVERVREALPDHLPECSHRECQSECHWPALDALTTQIEELEREWELEAQLVRRLQRNVRALYNQRQSERDRAEKAERALAEIADYSEAEFHEGDKAYQVAIVARVALRLSEDTSDES